MGVVRMPAPHRQFNGMVFLERVSKRVSVSKITSHQNFTDQVIINQVIKNGKWRGLFDTETHLLVFDALTGISTTCTLDNCVLDRSKLHHTTFDGNAETIMNEYF